MTHISLELVNDVLNSLDDFILLEELDPHRYEWNLTGAVYKRAFSLVNMYRLDLKIIIFATDLNIRIYDEKKYPNIFVRVYNLDRLKQILSFFEKKLKIKLLF